MQINGDTIILDEVGALLITCMFLGFLTGVIMSNILFSRFLK